MHNPMNILRRPFRYRNENIVFILIGINVAVYLAQMLFNNVEHYFAMFPPSIIFNGWVWQFVTYMFVHDPGGIGHLLFNMFALFIFGRQVEWQMGSREFLLFYLLTGALAGVFSFAVYYFSGIAAGNFFYARMGDTIVRVSSNWLVSLMGASGAIFAVQLAFATFFPRSVIYIWGILPLRAPIMVLAFTALGLVFMVTGRGGNVAHVTHLAGFGFGWLYFVIRFRINPWKEMRRNW